MHLFGFEIIQAARHTSSRLTRRLVLLQDLSNQQYAVAFNAHLGRFGPWEAWNCFEKANGIDMLIGLGRIAGRLTPDHKERLYEQTGDLENFGRFWEQVLNREAHESHRLYRLEAPRHPTDPEDDSCGEPDRKHEHRNSNEREEDIRSIICQLATHELLHKDTWPRQTVAAAGYEGAYPDRHG